jgi:hypothetical protein
MDANELLESESEGTAELPCCVDRLCGGAMSCPPGMFGCEAGLGKPGRRADGVDTITGGTEASMSVAVALSRICRMDSDASPPLASRFAALLLSAPLLSATLLSALLLSTLLLSALLLLLGQSACACSVSGVTASTSIDGDRGTDVDDDDSDAGASELECSLEAAACEARSGLICQHVFS